MNFMSGFYDEASSKVVSSSTSSPSSHQQRGLQPNYTYHHQESEPRYGCTTTAIDFMRDSSPTKDDESEDRMLFRQGSGGGEGASTGANSLAMVEKEHMFDKVVTPSDVGKLNRLVIPKQHAEKYFPLDSSSNEKGLLLNFEDRNGKPWRFRYSYWNSSQSYVMTKGWSRFVKEKKLDAGDIVSFQRGVGEIGKDRLFIDWRRRPDAPEIPSHMSIPHQLSFQRSIHPWNSLFLQSNNPRENSYFVQANPIVHHQPHYPSSYGYGHSSYGYNSSHHTVVNGNPCSPGSVVYALAPQRVGGMVLRGGGSGGGVGVEQMVFDSVPVVQGKAAAKRLRLFGVNMECPISESDECDILSSTTLPHSSMAIEPPFDSSSSTSSALPNLQFLQRPYNQNAAAEKGKGSMSLDLDI